MNHYTYMMTLNDSTDKELFYIGVRSCLCDPKDDIHYLGSSKLVNHLIMCGLDFSKEILQSHPCRNSAFESEQLLISQCIDSLSCLNLKAMDQVYNSAQTEFKLRHIKQHYPEIIPNTSWAPIYRGINAKDMIYCVGNYSNILEFIEHPENLKYYYTSTGTKTFWPGRTDRLMTIKKNQNSYYKTAVESVEGTPEEQIRELLSCHFVEGQKFNILETAIELSKIVKNDEIYKLIESYISNNKEFAFLKSRLKKAQNQAIRVPIK